MGIFDKLKAPVFLKDNSNAEEQLSKLEALRPALSGDALNELNLEIQRVTAGIYGEKQVHYELETSHIPMYVLHDLYLEYEGLTAQIDYLIITHKHQYVIECKNLYGDIEINSSGDFIRTFTYGRYKKKEGIYSPITQNRRHLELIKAMRAAEKSFLGKALFERYFYENYRSVVVLANPKTVLNAKYAKKEVKNQVIRVDQLCSYIRRIDSDNTASSSERDMEALANYFLAAHKPQSVDYTQRFAPALQDKPVVAPAAGPASNSADKPKAQPDSKPDAIPNATPDETPEQGKKAAEQPSVPVCPKCGAPMVKRIASKGARAGKAFYGCSRFPACRTIINVD